MFATTLVGQAQQDELLGRFWLNRGEDRIDREVQLLIDYLVRETGGQMPLIGVGGISSAADAYAKIRAGATAVQLYTAMVFWGVTLVDRIVHGLDEMLAHDGFANVSDAVGTGVEDWL